MYDPTDERLDELFSLLLRLLNETPRQPGQAEPGPPLRADGAGPGPPRREGRGAGPGDGGDLPGRALGQGGGAPERARRRRPQRDTDAGVLRKGSGEQGAGRRAWRRPTRLSTSGFQLPAHVLYSRLIHRPAPCADKWGSRGAILNQTIKWRFSMSIRDQEARDYHFLGKPGKIEVVPTKPCLTARDLSLAYTPGRGRALPRHREEPRGRLQVHEQGQPRGGPLQRHGGPGPRRHRRPRGQAGHGRQGRPLQAVRAAWTCSTSRSTRTTPTRSSRSASSSSPRSAASTSRTSRPPSASTSKRPSRRP